MAMFEDEFEISSREIIFLENDKAKNLKLMNNSNLVLLYKIRTNNLHAIQASPNRGYINPHQSISLLIKSKKPDPFQALLRIAYAKDKESTGENFSIEWANISKQYLKQVDVKIKRVPKIQQLKSLRAIESNMMNEEDPIGVMTLEEQKYIELQEQLNKQKQVNLKLGQQLSVTASKLTEINRQRLQIKVNKSIGIICEDFHPSLTTFILFLLSTFVFGFLAGKILE